MKQTYEHVSTAKNSNALIIERERKFECCPYCGSISFKKNGHTEIKNQKYLCKDCKKSFCSTTGTIAWYSKLNYQKWNDYTNMLKISTTTAFSMRHKIISSFNQYDSSSILQGEIEADELYFDINLKGTKRINIPRFSHKRGTAPNKRGISREKICVVTALDSFDHVIINLAGVGPISIKMLEETFKKHTKDGSLLISDSKSAYQKFSMNHHLVLKQIPSGFHTVDDIYNLSELNSMHCDIRGFFYSFRGVSTKHLKDYLSWYRVMKIMKYKFEIIERLNRLLSFAI